MEQSANEQCRLSPEAAAADRAFFASWLSRTRHGGSPAIRRELADFRKLSDAAAVRLNRMGATLEETSKRLGRIEFAPEAQLRTGALPTPKGEREHP